MQQHLSRTDVGHGESAYERVTTALEQHGCDRRGSDYICPAHPDNEPSLSVSEGDTGVLMHCHAGCETADVLGALGLQTSDLFNEPLRKKERSKTVATYSYVDEQGSELFQVVRKEPKDFRQRRSDGAGGWIWNLQDTQRVLYRLPQLLSAIRQGQQVFICEGEKDVHAIESAGGVATCNPGGAGKWRIEYSDIFTGANVTIVCDRDSPGIKHAKDVERSLKTVVNSLQVVQAKEGKDAADHLALYGLDEFVPFDSDKDSDGIKNPDNSILPFRSLADLIAEVDGKPHPGYLVRGIWPADSYGVIAAEQKLGKTWMILDLALSVASGEAWMGVFPVDRPGAVVVFLGEGGERKMLRRMRAIATHKGIDLDSGQLPIELCMRVPELTNEQHLEIVRAKLLAFRPALVVVDPLYLAARGANGADLYGMGVYLETVQRLAQDVEAALVVVHHWNKTGQGTGASRMSGAGPAEWGRVLISMSANNKVTEPETNATIVSLQLEVSGDEVPDMTYRFRRRVWADAEDLESPMHYEVEQLTGSVGESGQLRGLSPGVQRTFAALEGANGDWLTVQDIGDIVAGDESGYSPLKKRTIQKALQTLTERLLVEAHPGNARGGSGGHWRVEPSTNEHSAALVKDVETTALADGFGRWES